MKRYVRIRDIGTRQITAEITGGISKGDALQLLRTEVGKVFILTDAEIAMNGKVTLTFSPGNGVGEIQGAEGSKWFNGLPRQSGWYWMLPASGKYRVVEYDAESRKAIGVSEKLNLTRVLWSGPLEAPPDPPHEVRIAAKRNGVDTNSHQA